MSRKIRENLLVTYGDQGIYPAGQPVYDTTNDSGRGPTVLVNPGQFVIYDPVTLLSLDATSWNKADNGRFVMGVGDDPDGRGYSTAIRKSFGDIMYGCHIKSIETSCPTCSLVDVKDAFLRGCVSVDEPVTIKIGVSDGVTQNQFGYNQYPFWTATAVVPSKLCNACDEPLACEDLIQEMLNQFKAQKRGDRLHNLKRGGFPGEDLPFYISPLYTTSYRYTLSTSDTECESCAHVQGITGITIGGQVTTFTHSKTGNFTSFGQIELIVNQINKALDGKGTAMIIRGTGSCCPYVIEVNTCRVMGNMISVDGEGDAATVVPTTTSPFATITEEEKSYMCSGTDTTFTPTCGFRVVAKPVEYNSDCIFNKNQPTYPVRTVSIHIANPFKSNPFYIKETQKATYPQGLGFLWALKDYKSDTGGTGRDYSGTIDQYGFPALQGANSIINGVRVDSGTEYVSAAIEHSFYDDPLGHIGYMNVLNGTTYVVIPKSDTTTKTAIQNALNFYITHGDCSKLPAITFC